MPTFETDRPMLAATVNSSNYWHRPSSLQSQSLELFFSKTLTWSSLEHDDNSASPVILAANGLHGSLKITANSEKLALRCSDTIRIDLKGLMSVICREEEQWGMSIPCLQPGHQQVILAMSVVRPSNVELRYSTTHESYSFPFDFTLPQSSIPTSPVDLDGNLNFGSSLPSSVSLRWQRLLKSGRTNEYSAGINYYVKAVIIREGSVIAFVKRPVIIFDVSDVAPPICSADFTSEYLFSFRSSLKKSLLAKCGSIQVMTGQPTAFQFDSTHENALAQMHLTFIYEDFGSGIPKSSLQSLEMEMAWRLRIITFFSASELQRVPTIEQAKESSEIFHSCTFGPFRHLKARLHRWSWQQSSDEVDSPGFWEDNVFVRLVLPKLPLRAPTFFNAHFARRYVIESKIYFRGFGRASLQLILPCQILYQTTLDTDPEELSTHIDQNINESNSDSFGDLEVSEVWELPTYTP